MATKKVQPTNSNSKKKITKASRGKITPWSFPKHPLEAAIKLAKAIEEKNAGHPMYASDLAKVVGFKKVSDWRFLELLKSTSQYGLVSGTGTTARVSLEETGGDIVAPSSSSQRQQALLDAFRNVEDFAKVRDFYRGGKIPEDEYFVNTLVREFKVDRERVGVFADVFRKNLSFLSAFDAQGKANTSVDGPIVASEKHTATEDTSTETPKRSRVREFLDTCFVMMPFGDWFDRYYQDIYVAAIREAGFEPVRADELFSTGSVVEQIWEQIEKADVLLADLTGKNANVFYELGLAHAALKPVVFTAGSVEDVPFDLRHLRVIIYDIREPQWAEKLTQAVTDHLKNAKADPEKSIPQPFRSRQAED